MKVPTPIDDFNTDSARPRSTTSGEASLVWEDGKFRSLENKGPQLSQQNGPFSVYCCAKPQMAVSPHFARKQIPLFGIHNLKWVTIIHCLTCDKAIENIDV